jgi:uncharacterized membrane protein YcgQ (UPF0703/DUF1980 family)
MINRNVPNYERGDLFALLDRLDRDPSSAAGSQAVVTGQWTPPSDGHPASVSRRVMTCCAADAVAVGFDVYPARSVAIASGARVRVRGTVRSEIIDGELRYALVGATITRVRTE